MTKSQEEMHVENERRLTRLEILVVGLYVLLLGMRAAPYVVAFIHVP